MYNAKRGQKFKPNTKQFVIPLKFYKNLVFGLDNLKN